MSRSLQLFAAILWASIAMNVPAFAQSSSQSNTAQYFAEGVNVSGWDTHYYLTNPTPYSATVNLQILGEGIGVFPREYVVPANRTIGISMAQDFSYARQSFGVLFQVVKGPSVSIERYVVRDGVGILTYTKGGRTATAHRIHSACNPGAAHTYLAMANPFHYSVDVFYLVGNSNRTQRVTVAPFTRHTLYFPGDPVISASVIYGMYPIVSEKITYDSNYTSAKICPAR